MSKKLLIIDDSALMRRVISDIIKSDIRYEVADIASNGLEGFDLIVANPNKYDVILLDINMPKMNGLELLEQLQKRRIRQTIVVVSTVAKKDAKETIKALELGAFDFVTKPENFIETKSDSFKEKLLSIIEVASSSSNRTKTYITYKERPRDTTKSTEQTARISSLQRPRTAPGAFKAESYRGVKSNQNKIVALATSTGGPKSLQDVIPYLPANLDAAVVLVQHMPKGFTASLASRLNDLSKVKVKEAAHGDVIEKGCVYIAPGGSQMRIAKSGSLHKIVITDEPARGGLKPCADIMYESLTESGFDDITCVVLTGMGADGTSGIKQLKKSKNVYVISQNEETCVVYGMPKNVAEAGLSNEVRALGEIAGSITKNVGVR